MKTPPESLHEVIRKAENVVLVTHINPDGDALGSLIGLADTLVTMGKNVFRYLEEPVSHLYAFLPDTGLMQSDIPALQDFVRLAGEEILCISLDCGARQRLGRHEAELMRTARPPVRWFST